MSSDTDSRELKPTEPPDADEATMRCRFAALDSTLLERLMAENAQLRAELENSGRKK